MQIKITLSYHLTPLGWPLSKQQQQKYKGWQECVDTHTHKYVCIINHSIEGKLFYS